MSDTHLSWPSVELLKNLVFACSHVYSGAGELGDFCGNKFDLPCNATLNLTCGAAVVGAGIAKQCRLEGNGTLNDPCDSSSDVACRSQLACKPDAVTTLWTCQAYSAGIIGDVCNPTSLPCAANVVCAVDTLTTGYFTCRAPGNGASGALCGLAGDANCTAGYVCDSQSDGTATCRPVGLGALGNACGSVGDAVCAKGTICDMDLEICRDMGLGGIGDHCGQPGDAFCQAGSICSQDATLVAVCRTPGTGVLGSECGNSLDVGCGQTTVPGKHWTESDLACPTPGNNDCSLVVVSDLCGRLIEVGFCLLGTRKSLIAHFLCLFSPMPNNGSHCTHTLHMCRHFI
jgi:hypothetical protein